MPDSSNSDTLDHNLEIKPIPSVIADINVLLNGITGRSNTLSRRIYEAFQRGELQFVISEALLAELENVFDYSTVMALGVTPRTAARVMRELMLLGEYIAPVPRYDWDSLPDTKDWYLLDLLFESRADALVTQDKKILSTGAKLRMPVYKMEQIAEMGWI